MRERLGIALVVGVFGLVSVGAGLAPSSAAASGGDVASTHAYLEANYAVLHSVVSGWPSDEAKIRALDRKIQGECPLAGAGSPQNEEAQKLSTEVVGALWATVYDANAKAIQRFAKAVGSLHWSNAKIDRGVRHYTQGLREMMTLRVPDLCQDVRAWSATGFKAAPASSDQFDHRVEAIEVTEPSQRLMAPYERTSDRSLAARVAHLATRYSELEFSRGQSDWNELLETLALNQ
ncbi:MAG: hypothetical protein WB998_04100 [Solirubrobacteraceae bacterium]